jgi:hypothetical protein
MSKIWKYFTRGAAVASILFTELPAALADKKLTMKELASLFQDICIAMDWPIEIAVPDSVADIAAIIRIPE